MCTTGQKQTFVSNGPRVGVYAKVYIRSPHAFFMLFESKGDVDTLVDYYVYYSNVALIPTDEDDTLDINYHLTSNALPDSLPGVLTPAWQIMGMLHGCSTIQTKPPGYIISLYSCTMFLPWQIFWSCCSRVLLVVTLTKTRTMFSHLSKY